MIFPLVNAAQSGRAQFFLWLAPVVLVALAFIPDPPDAPTVPHWGLLVVAALFAALFQLAPRRLRYRLTPNGLEISRLLGTTLLPYAGMQVRKTVGRLGVRTFGTGLPGYLTGAFSFGSDGVRSVTALASVASGGVLIGVPVSKEALARPPFILPPKPTSGAEPLRWYFLTPADPQELLVELVQRGAVVAP
ncbi:PH domain-containing protein [Deinococcus sp. QL22]|uniref:PH domain-containing protein n=1 Tax=Deinococcus sp. QL22 TaxID=2939437 RepID=UPI00201798D3|nr:PH domain-containing protein [Deinococcus sp. QL22]UQN06212.1 PH domain-containing protein [Deinococcus sp. QL22]